MSQGELAARAGLSRGTIAKLELGTYRSPDLSTVEAIARALEVPLEALLTPHATTDVAPYIEAFLTSPWAEALAPTDEEREWLGSLPEMIWAGSNPTAETIALLLQWHRQTRLQ